MSLLSDQAYITFNLLGDQAHPHRQKILQWMNQHYHCLEQKKYTHRKLLNGNYIEQEVFIYKTF